MEQYSDYGAVLPDMWIEIGSDTRRRMEEIQTRDLLLASHEVCLRVKNIWKSKVVCYYQIYTINGRVLKASQLQCVWTKMGWKRVRRLVVGDEVLCYDYHEGRQYYPIRSVDRVEEETCVYTVDIGRRTFVANGFICSDYAMQSGV